MPRPISAEDLKTIEYLFYDEKQNWGRDKFYKLVQDKGLNVSRRAVDAWLKNQQIRQLQAPTKYTKTIRSTLLDRPRQQLGVDLVDLTKWADGNNKWLLNVIDLFTKKLWSRAMPDKNANTVLKYMKEIIKDVGELPTTLRSDNGSEFISDPWKKYFNDIGVKLVYSAPHKPVSNGQVERVNQVIKRLIKKQRLQGNMKWSSYLQQLVNNYNSTEQATIKMPPDEAEQKENFEKVHQNTQETLNKSGAIVSRKIKFFPFDKVRIKMPSDNETNWSREVYFVKQVMIPRRDLQKQIQYKLKPLKREKGNTLQRIFYENDLQKISDIQTKDSIPDTFTIRRLEHPTVQNKIRCYTVFWRGYKDSTVEPRDVLIEDVPKIVKEFEKENKVVWSKHKSKGWSFTMNPK